MDRIYTISKKFITLLLIFLLLSGPRCKADDNLILNGDFETGNGSLPLIWILNDAAEGNTFDWVTNEVHSGKRAVKMSSINPPVAGYSMDVTSNKFQVPPYSRVEAAIWIKAENVISSTNESWYKLRVTLTVYDIYGSKIEHRDLMAETGSFPWKHIKGGMIIPAQASLMDLSIKLTSSTGTVWIDDAKVTIAQEVPVISPNDVSMPVLIPNPWQASIPGNDFELSDIAIVEETSNATVRNALEAFFESTEVQYEFLGADDPKIEQYASRLILGSDENLILNQTLSAKFPGCKWSDIGQQGYFLSVNQAEGANQIYIGANTDVGRFYAVQTLKQLAIGRRIYQADILDKPSMSYRGIPMGLQWFDERNNLALKRLTELKFNFVWAQGSFLEDYLGTDNWRLDFTAQQIAILEEFITLYQNNFIDVWIAIGPRGKNPPLQYSSDNDINTIVTKMLVLYELGLRHFGLHFDDLQNVGEDRLLTQQDIEFFDNDIGTAQVYFIYEVYNRLKLLKPDVEFMVIPMDYSQSGNFGDLTPSSMRLRKFYELPAEIEIFSTSSYSEDVLATTCMTGRASMIAESNFYVEEAGPLPEYVIPFLNFIDWHCPVIRDRIKGFAWLPQNPQMEDRALVSWHTAGDFAWAPERYDPNASFERAAAWYLQQQ